MVNSDVILNRMSVKNGRIVLPDGLSYSLLVLPDQDNIPLAVLHKLELMVKDGATIIGRKPLTVPGLNDYSEQNRHLSQIVDRMWEGIDGKNKMINKYGEGSVIYGLTAKEVLSTEGIDPDFSHEYPSGLDFIHRKSGESDIYFIRNTSGKFYSGDCSFRIIGKYPELWDPSTGNQVRLEEFTDENGRISMNLDLEPGASVFVVFTGNRRSIPVILKKTSGADKSTNIDGSWRVTFPEGWGAPAEASFDRLVSWTESKNEGIKYFSGTACYHKTISVQERAINNTRIELSLGEVFDVAEVYLNGKSAGILWKVPYKLDITELVQTGENDLKIEVVNQWVNRLTGDMLSDPGDRFCRTNQPYITRDDMGYDNWAEGGDETFRLKTSGLLGPVKLLYSSNKNQ